jgi:hypothetical protein
VVLQFSSYTVCRPLMDTTGFSRWYFNFPATQLAIRSMTPPASAGGTSILQLKVLLGRLGL